MRTAGLRELRQNASELVRLAEAGESIVVTVSGREVAVLGPASRNRWRRSAELAGLFASAADPTWASDRELISDNVIDPFHR